MSEPLNHLALIIDGNRRWALAQGMNKVEGHRYGLDNIFTILTHARSLGISYVSLYVLSTENWNRTRVEVTALLALFHEFVLEEKQKILDQQCRVRFVGDLGRFDKVLQRGIEEMEAETQAYAENGTVFVCLSYGGRLEITRAAEKMARSGEAYTEENFEKHLWSGDMPDVDLMIRTGGNQRLSNFLLWRNAYAELYFTDTLWPDFSPEELENLVRTYQETVRVNKGT